ncbi:MAG: hypothetical protein EHM23_30490 [Acidobacteria bacterium]|jgi:hypothetical protein|nr:MAG: hypothetical protein EHM23_30490 [Acidobacteriota bacterium]
MAMTAIQVVGAELERVDDSGAIPVLFEREDTFYSFISKRPVQVVSERDMRIPLELRPGGKFGHFDSDGGDLGRGEGPVFDKAVINTVNLRHAVEWTKRAEWATDDRRKAVVNTLRHLLATSMAEFRRNVDSLSMQGGDGVLGTISAFSSAAGVTTATLGSDGFGARLLRYGQPINIYNSTLTTNRTAAGERSITYHSGPDKQIKFADVAGVANGDKIVVSGVVATPPTSLLGVPYHHSSASTGLWLGFDRALTPEIRANSVNAAGGLALPHARLAMNKVGDRVGMGAGKKVTAWMHPAQLVAYEELGYLMSVINRPASGREKLDLYFGENMTIAGVPIKTHFSWDKTRIDFIANDAWGRAEMHSPGFYTVDGRRIFEIRGASGGVATSQVFYITASFNYFVRNPAEIAYIYGLTVPAGY